MTETRIALDLSVSICDLATDDEAEEIQARIEEAIGSWKPTITATVREYPAA
jgi:hypothetical protein